MHILLLRRVTRPYRLLCSRIAAVALTLGALLLFCGPRAGAAESPLPVQVVSAKAQSAFETRRRYAGSIAASRSSMLGFTRAGEVGALLVDLGDEVAAEQLLARLVQNDVQANVAEAKAALTLAEANASAATADLELAGETEARFRNLIERGHASAQEYDEQRLTLSARTAQLGVARAEIARARAALQAATVRLQQTEIRAPFAGIIQSRLVDEGTQVGPTAVVYRLIEQARQEAHIGVPDQLAPTLSIGSEARLHWGAQSYAARLRTVLPEIDPATRTLTAIYELVDAANRLPIGAVVQLGLDQNVAGNGFWLPLAALTESDRGLWGIYVVGANSQVERHLVEILHSESRRVYVRGTLEDGDQVVAEGVHRLVPGQTVTVQQAALAAAGR